MREKVAWKIRLMTSSWLNSSLINCRKCRKTANKEMRHKNHNNNKADFWGVQGIQGNDGYCECLCQFLWESMKTGKMRQTNSLISRNTAGEAEIHDATKISIEWKGIEFLERSLHDVT